ncbi:hypothetical protein OG559_09090 [Micromonospora sp. NBC_01405]|uniref:hypothetical protein n=1 Tax=Micromonospora sp. NBC_01405 TaxID=2903589 RepID=UPI00324F6B21
MIPPHPGPAQPPAPADPPDLAVPGLRYGAAVSADEYQGNSTTLLIYLATLKLEAATQLAALTPGTPPTDLTDRFLSWARARR